MGSLRARISRFGNACRNSGRKYALPPPNRVGTVAQPIIQPMQVSKWEAESICELLLKDCQIRRYAAFQAATSAL